jgi:thiamine-phosphate pyrophosphorylase
MKLIVCSVPETLTDEHRLVSSLFDYGLSCFHLRKPGFSKEDMRYWLLQRSPIEQRQVVLHAHWSLADEFELKGLHFGASVLKQFTSEEQQHWMHYAKQRNLTISSSAHHQEEIERLPLGLDYVWLSPVFESISKAGYASAYSNSQLDEWVKKLKAQKQTQVFALGGVNVQHLEELSSRGFDGAVVLGAVWTDIEGWQDKERIKERIQQLITSCNTIPTS